MVQSTLYWNSIFHDLSNSLSPIFDLFWFASNFINLHLIRNAFPWNLPPSPTCYSFSPNSPFAYSITFFVSTQRLSLFSCLSPPLLFLSFIPIYFLFLFHCLSTFWLFFHCLHLPLLSIPSMIQPPKFQFHCHHWSQPNAEHTCQQSIMWGVISIVLPVTSKRFLNLLAQQQETKISIERRSTIACFHSCNRWSPLRSNGISNNGSMKTIFEGLFMVEEQYYEYKYLFLEHLHKSRLLNWNWQSYFWFLVETSLFLHMYHVCNNSWFYGLVDFQKDYYWSIRCHMSKSSQWHWKFYDKTQQVF